MITQFVDLALRRLRADYIRWSGSFLIFSVALQWLERFSLGKEKNIFLDKIETLEMKMTNFSLTLLFLTALSSVHVEGLSKKPFLRMARKRALMVDSGPWSETPWLRYKTPWITWTGQPLGFAMVNNPHQRLRLDEKWSPGHFEEKRLQDTDNRLSLQDNEESDFENGKTAGLQEDEDSWSTSDKGEAHDKLKRKSNLPAHVRISRR